MPKESRRRKTLRLKVGSIKDSDGNILHSTPVQVDITERQRAEEALRRSEEKFLKLFQGSPAAVALSRVKDGRLIEVNNNFERIFGYRREEVVGSKVSDIGIWVDASQREELTKRLLSERSVRDLELRFRTKNGGILTCLVSTELVEVGNEPCILSVNSDITERKLAEEALRNSEERFRLAAQAGKMFAYEWDAKTDVIVRSPQAAHILGMDEGERITGQQIMTRVHIDDKERLEAAISALSPESPNLQISYRITRPDGTLIWVERNSRAHFDERGRILRVVGMVRNITEGKLAEEALRTSEERFSSLFENATVGIYRTTPGGRILAANPTLIRMLGYQDFESLATRNLEEKGFEPSYQRRVFCDRIEQEGKVIGLESAWTKQDGSTIFVRESARAIRGPDGKILYYDGIVEDITARKRDEEALRESEARFNQLAERSRTTTWEVDPQGLFTFASHVSEVVWGYSPDELVGRMCFYDLHPEEGREKFKAAAFAITERREPFDNLVHAVKTKDGRITWGSVNGIPMLNADGTLRGYRGSFADITERKMVEHELLALNSELKTQTALLQSREELLRIFVKNAPVGVAMFDRDMRYLQVSDRWCENHSLDTSQVLGRTHYELNPDLPDRWKEIHRRGLEGETLRADEDRWDRESGVKWFRWEVRPWWNLESKPGGILLLAEDITHRKQMEEALSDMTRMLVEAQEQERARIARELHDDINQRLALLSIGLGQIRANRHDLSPEILDSLRRLQSQTKQISADVQALSHDLHSPNLEFLGVVEGMKIWCDEFGERQGINVAFKHYGSLDSLPPEISLCLFRVLQESLHNTAKHAATKRAEVQLREESGEIELVIRDSGRGFDIEAATRGRGLGLTSMQERVRLVGGKFVIDSKPSGGTAIQIRVPFRRLTPFLES
jgi:PAS domain S-box-containing protein